MTPSEVLAFAKDNDVKMVDYRFVDVPGAWQHFSSPIDELEEETFEEGVGFDGSSIRGFQTIDKSDMILIPDEPDIVSELSEIVNEPQNNAQLSDVSEEDGDVQKLLKI